MSPSGVNGSSPLARGTGQRPLVIAVAHRFIPAGAGNRIGAFTTASTRAVHPRWRGEQSPFSAPISICTGSSPLARGTATSVLHDELYRRFIPAGAGNRCQRTPAGDPLAVHPRWRGEQQAFVFGHGLELRFIPAGAGNRIGRYLMQNGIGFIPAGAGNSPAHHAALIHFSVHPRWRGEQAASHFVAIKKHGSSPLARGTGVPINMCNKQFRFIPAGAGNRNRFSPC